MNVMPYAICHLPSAIFHMKYGRWQMARAIFLALAPILIVSSVIAGAVFRFVQRVKIVTGDQALNRAASDA